MTNIKRLLFKKYMTIAVLAVGFFIAGLVSSTTVPTLLLLLISGLLGFFGFFKYLNEDHKLLEWYFNNREKERGRQTHKVLERCPLWQEDERIWFLDLDKSIFSFKPTLRENLLKLRKLTRDRVFLYGGYSSAPSHKIEPHLVIGPDRIGEGTTHSDEIFQRELEEQRKQLLLKDEILKDMNNEITI